MSSPPSALLPAVLGTIDIVSGVGKAKKKNKDSSHRLSPADGGIH
jgi:hypothetical protein